MKFKELAELFQQLEKTSSNLKMIDLICDFLKKTTPEEAKLTAYLLQGKIAPDYKGLELGLAEKLVIKAIALAFQQDVGKVEKLFKELGDLGDVAKSLAKEKPSSLEIQDVFNDLKKIALTQGKGSQEKKLEILAIILKKSSPLEAKYIVRSVLGTLRLGASDMTFLYALSKVLFGSKEGKKKLEEVFNILSDLGEVAYLALKKGKKALEKVEPILGVPIRMMLAQRVKDIKEIKENIENEIFVEVKYDGERIQAHLDGNEIILFSRRHENITNQFPDIIEDLKKNIKVKNAILEGEVVAVDKDGKLLPFQVLMQRRRKYDIHEYVKKIPVKYFLFDLLYLNGENLLYKPLKERKQKLESIIKKTEKIEIAKYSVCSPTNEDEIEREFLNALKEGGEGVMIKDSNSVYESGVRAWRWLKFKKDYKEELVDTFDVVVIGGIYGTGKRSKTYGSLLVALYDPEKNKYFSFTKVGAGFTDEELENLPKKLKKYEIKEKSKLVESQIEPDVWFEPKVVMEIKGADLTISPVHTVLREKIKKGGIALRFPRFVRWRDDKSPEQATTVQEVFQIYKKNL